jgi:yecA family protein
MEVANFDTESERLLQETISQLRSNEAVLTYYQLQGLLFAIACSPEVIKPSEWFELIWLDDEPQFDDEFDARTFYRQVVALADHIAEMIQQRRFLPFSASYSECWQSQFSQWCEGLLLGHHYLEDLWLIAMEDLGDQIVGDDIDTVLGLANTFADRVSAKQLSFEQGMELADEHLPEAYEVFCKVLGTYATVGSLWGELGWDYDAEQMFLALESVARDDLCPCGSGQVFSKCCLH